MKDRSLPKHLSLRRAVMVLHERVARLERAVERRTRPIGFTVEAHGDQYELDDDDAEIMPEET